MSEDGPIRISCTHGEDLVSAVVCGHLVTGATRVVGFVENSSDPDDSQAWCEACEAVYLREGSMTAAFREFNRMALVCYRCYEEIRAFQRA